MISKFVPNSNSRTRRFSILVLFEPIEHHAGKTAQADKMVAFGFQKKVGRECSVVKVQISAGLLSSLYPGLALRIYVQFLFSK